MNEQLKKPDRRIQRTHQLLREALMALIEENGYEAISIQEITDRANVSRTTFYLHFRDKDDLLFTTMEELYDELLEQAHFPTPDEILQIGNGTMIDSTDFKHVLAHARFYRMMIGKHGSAAFIMRIQDYLARMTRTRLLGPLAERGTGLQMPLDVVANGMAGLEIGLIRWWLEEDNLRRTPDEMALMLCQMSMLGAAWALGLKLTPDMLLPTSGSTVQAG